MSTKKDRLPLIYVVMTVVFWSPVASAFKLTLRYVCYLELVVYASLVSTVTLFIVVLLQGKLHLLISLTKADFARSLLLGFLNPFLYYLILLKAYSLLPAQEAQPLNFIWPITFVLLSIPLLGQRITVKSLLAIIVSFMGVIIISTRGNILSFRLTNPLGVSLAVGSSLIWSLFWIFNVKDRRDEAVKLFLNFLFGGSFATVAIVLFETMRVPPMPGILGAVYVGLFEMGITFLLWLKALQLSKSTALVANLVYLVPFLSLGVIHFTVGENIRPSSVVGLAFIVTGIIFQRYVSRSVSTP